MAGFGVIASNKQAVEHCRLFGKRFDGEEEGLTKLLANKMVLAFFDAKVREYEHKTYSLFVFSITPRLPEFYLWGFVIPVIALLFGGEKNVWVWVVTALFLSFGVWWHRWTYYQLLKLGYYRQHKTTEGLEYVGPQRTLRLVID